MSESSARSTVPSLFARALQHQERDDDVIAAFASSLPVSERAAITHATATVNEQTAAGFLR